MLPDYINEYLKAYFQMSSEDRRKILDERYFDTNPLTCPKEYLPYLAVEVGVNIDNLSEEKARVLINEAINSLNYKGTARSFKASLKPYTKARVKEWYEYDGLPYYFKAVLSPEDVNFKFDKKTYSKLTRVIEENKNVRSVFDGFEFELLLDEDAKVYSSFNIKPKIDKDLKLNLKNSKNIKTFDAFSFSIKLNKTLKKDLKLSNKVSTKQKGVSYVSLTSTLNLNFNAKNNNTIQGAMIWQV